MGRPAKALTFVCREGFGPVTQSATRKPPELLLPSVSSSLPGVQASALEFKATDKFSS